MPISADYHMHTPRCKHATGPLEGYIENAVAIGLREIGFSDHSPLPRGLGSNVRMDESELDDYVNDILRLRERYRADIPVRLGIELDYLDALEDYNARLLERYPWDYVIGSVHYLDSEARVPSWPRHYQGDVGALYATYFGQVRKLARSGLCDIIAHFDVAKRCGTSHGPREAATITETLTEIARAGISMEINTSGYRHSDLAEREPYPSLPVVKQALALGIPLTVNSDAHTPDHVATKFDVVEEFLKQNGCRTLVRFEKRQAIPYPL